MNYTDSHTHIYLEQFNDDIDEIITRAEKNNINQFLLPNIDISSISKVNELCHKYPNKCFPMIGLHPCSVDLNWKTSIKKMQHLFDKNTHIAIGEIGIDLYWDKSNLQLQQEAFLEQIKWAKKEKLPIVIHARESFDEIFEIIDYCIDKDLFGVFHCFTGNEEQAKKILSYNSFFFGIGGVVTFKNSKLDKVLKNSIPIEKIILETDAPYLAPTPYRGKRNEPSYIKNIIEKLTEIYDIDENMIAQITEENIKNIFFMK